MKILFRFFSAAILLFSCTSESQNEGSTLETNQELVTQQFLSALPDSLQPTRFLLKDMPAPDRVILNSTGGGVLISNTALGPIQSAIEAPQSQSLLLLRNEYDQLILDKSGNPIIQGDGGVSQFKNYTTDNGLALDAVYCSAIDLRGHLWFGTNGGGVSRFDGVDFTNYSTRQGLADVNIRSILADSKGNIWFGTIEKGVSKYDGSYFTSFAEGTGLEHKVIFSIFEDSKGNIWFGTDGGGVVKYDGMEFSTIQEKDGLANNEIVSIAEDKSGAFWFGTNGDGITKYDGTTFTTLTISDGLPSNRIRNLMVDSKGNLWIGTTGGGVSFYDGQQFNNLTDQEGLPSYLVRKVIEDEEGKIWMATDNGVAVYFENKITTYTRNQGLGSNSVYDIVQDKNGGLWFSTDGGGISRFDGSAFTSFTTAQGLGANIVFTTAQDKDGSYWFGTNGGGISHFDGKIFKTFSGPQGINGDLFYCSYRDSKDRIWFGSGGGGATMYDGTSFTTYTTLQGLPSNEVYFILEDKNEMIWFGSDAGITKFDGESFTTYDSSHGLADDLTIGMTTDSFGNLWVGTLNEGISRFDGLSFLNFGPDQGLAEKSVGKVERDRQGNLWVGTYSGLSFISSAKVTAIQDYYTKGNTAIALPEKLFNSFTTSYGLPDNVILQISEMGDEKIAVGTNLGIAIFDSPVADVLDLDSLRNIEIFNSNTGYPVKDLTDGQNGIFLDREGIMWAGTGNNKTALLRFDYSALKRNKVQPDLIFKQLRINEEVISWHSLNPGYEEKDRAKIRSEERDADEILVYGGTLSDTARQSLKDRFDNIAFDSINKFYSIPIGLVLPYRHNHINIDYGSNELSNPSLVEYQYILEGYDEEWSPILKKTSATFGNIQEGEYTFKVRARFTGTVAGDAGDWTEPISYEFSVLPPWYRTWWAYAFYLMGFLTLIYPLSIYNKNQAIKAEKVKAQERDLAHAKEIEKAYKNLKSTQSQLIQAEKMASLGELTAGIAHEIQNPLNFVNNFSEVSAELILEMNEDMAAGKLEDAKIIAEDIKQNLDRITLHGRRADSIVKAMLQHSRSGIGQKEKTDINAISEECLRLSYHGIRAKDKEFHSEYLTNLDPDVPHLNVIPRDIRKVLLNIYNNAFYAVSEYDKELKNGGDKNPEDGYVPIVSVTTKKLANGVEIRISDNGKGVASTIKDKVFQPFFTTKPTGKGTGLGLSLSYDIIKAHGGDLRVESPPSSTSDEIKQGAEFIITLPFDENSPQENESLVL